MTDQLARTSTADRMHPSSISIMCALEQRGNRWQKPNRKNEKLRIHELLVQKRNALRKALEGDFSQLQELRRAEDGDGSGEEQNTVASGHAEMASKEIAKVEATLLRMREGVYGKCIGCAGIIPMARLNALPYAERCIACQREFELEEE